MTRRQAEKAAGVAPATFARLAGHDAILERVAHGVYRLTGAPLPDHLGLRGAWLQLAPEAPAWQRRPDQGVVSHRSAAALYGFGHLPADGHDFTLPRRRQSRRADVRLHQRQLTDGEWIDLRGMPFTRPSRIASDLLYDREDPEAVAHLIADAIRAAYDDPGTFADALASHAARFGLRQGDGLGLLRWLLDLVGDPERSRWVAEARAHADGERVEQAGREELAQSQAGRLRQPRRVPPGTHGPAAGHRRWQPVASATPPAAVCLRSSARTSLHNRRRVDRQGGCRTL